MRARYASDTTNHELRDGIASSLTQCATCAIAFRISFGPRPLRLEYGAVVGFLAAATPLPLEVLANREPRAYAPPEAAGNHLESLIKSHEDVRLNNLQNAARLFVGGKNDAGAATPLAAMWMSFGKWFVARTHLEVTTREHDDAEFFDRSTASRRCSARGSSTLYLH